MIRRRGIPRQIFVLGLNDLSLVTTVWRELTAVARQQPLVIVHGPETESFTVHGNRVQNQDVQKLPALIRQVQSENRKILERFWGSNIQAIGLSRKPSIRLTTPFNTSRLAQHEVPADYTMDPEQTIRIFDLLDREQVPVVPAFTETQAGWHILDGMTAATIVAASIQADALVLLTHEEQTKHTISNLVPSSLVKPELGSASEWAARPRGMDIPGVRRVIAINAHKPQALMQAIQFEGRMATL